MKAPAFKVGALIAAILFLVAVFFIGVPSMRGPVTDAISGENQPEQPAVSGRMIHYFNNDVAGDDIGNFGPDRKVQAENSGSNRQTWIATNSGTGDFFDSIAVDPALCAAVALHMDETLNLPEKILSDEQSYVVSQRANQAHLHFLRDNAYWDRAIGMIKNYLTQSTISIVRIRHDMPTMYMARNMLEGDKPSVYATFAQNAGACVVKFDLGEQVGAVRFNIECGYQPVGVTYWTSAPVEEETEPGTLPVVITPEPVIITAEPVIVTQEPVVTPEPVVVTPTPAPVIVTEEPVQHATRTVTGRIQYYLNGEWVVLDTIHYAGGYFEYDDPKYSGLPMENEYSYGVSLVRNTDADTVAAWFYELPSSPEQIVRLLIQMGLIQKSPLKSESDYAYELMALPAEKYERWIGTIFYRLGTGKHDGDR